MTTNIAVVSGATGVGKSSLVAQLCALMAQRGQRVRGIGLDRQCTLSLWYGLDVDPDEGDLYVGDLLKQKNRVKTGETDDRGKPVKRTPTIADIEQNTEVDGLTIVPEATALESDQIELANLGVPAGEVLQTALTTAPPVDVNLMDAPGELNVISLASIAAADHVLIVISPTIKQVSISRVLERIDQLQARGVAAQVSGIVPNVVPSGRDGVFYADVLSEIRGDGETEGYPDLVLPQIRRQHWEPYAYALSQPLPVSCPDAGVTDDYRRLLAALDERGVTPMPAASTVAP